MFTINQIHEAHEKIKTGADFPRYIEDLLKLKVISFEIWVIDSRSTYYGENNYFVHGKSVYEDLHIKEDSNKEQFLESLKVHQDGKTDYFTFCKDCAATGIMKWIVDLKKNTCTYFDKSNQVVYTEKIG